MNETDKLDIDKLESVKAELRGDHPKSPAEIVLEEMSERLTRNADVGQILRIELFLGNLISISERAMAEVAEGNKGKDVEKLLEEVKESRGYGTMTRNIGIEDETVVQLINEAKVRLYSQYEKLQDSGKE